MCATNAFSKQGLIRKNLPYGAIQFALNSNISKMENKNQKPFTNWSGDEDLGTVPVGQARIFFVNWSHIDPAVFSQQITIGPVAGSSEISLVSDTCVGATLYYGQDCVATFSYQPTTKGKMSASVVMAWSNVWNDSNNPPSGASHTFTFFGSSFDRPTDKPECEAGSIINVSSQSLGETIPLVGAPFKLHYSSQFAPEYVTTQAQFVSAFGFNYEGWTVSLQHLYNKEQHRLFLGTGSVSARDYTTLSNGNLMVTSPGGDEIYIFSATGKHLETRTFLTGALKYSFIYDTSDRLIKVVDVYGNQTVVARDTNGRMATITSPYGQVTTIAKNSNGLISSVTNPNSEIYSMTYKTGTTLLQTFTKPGAQVSTFTYDANGKLTKDLGHGGNFWQLIQQVDGSLTKSSQMNRQTSYFNSYDPDGGLSSTETKPSGYSTFSYELLNGSQYVDSVYQSTYSNLTDDARFGYIYQRPGYEMLTVDGGDSFTFYNQKVEYPTGVTASPFNFSTLTSTVSTGGRTAIDKFDNVTKTRMIVSPLGIVSRVVYDQYEKPISIKAASETPRTFTYDSKGRLVQSAQGPKNQVVYSYNEKGFLESITNGRSETTSYIYDPVGRILSTIFPDARYVQYNYDANGNVTSLTPPNKPTHYFEFNALELPSKYLPPALSGVTNKNTQYAYNLDKQMTSVTKPTGAVLSYNYDATNGLLQSISTTNSGTHSFTYTNDRIDTVTTASGLKEKYTYHGQQIKSAELTNSSNATIGKITYEFDGDHRPRSKTTVGQSSSDSDGGAYFTYNNDNQLTQYGPMALAYSTTTGKLVGTVTDAIKDTRSYDRYGALSKYTAYAQGSMIYSYELVRDNMSRITAMTETTLGVVKKFIYTYDIVGRLTDVTQDGVSVASFIYDSNGNRISTTLNGTTYASTFDDQDRMQNFGSQVFAYNANGELTTSTSSIGAQINYTRDNYGNLTGLGYPGSLTSQLIYDAQNRVISKSKLQRNDTSQFVYESQNRIGAAFSTTGEMQNTFYYPTGSHSPDLVRPAGGSHHVIIKNHLGSPVLVVRAYDGEVVQQLTYNALGKATTNTNPNFQPFGYAGGLYDNDTKLVNFGARDYDTETGRWLTKDPIGFSGGDSNLYGYVLNDPVNMIDPSGLEGSVVDMINSNPGYCATGGAAFNYLLQKTQLNIEKDRLTDEWNSLNKDGCGTKNLEKSNALQNRISEINNTLSNATFWGFQNQSVRGCMSRPQFNPNGT